MGKGDIPKSKWPILGKGLLEARELHEINGRKLRQLDISNGTGIALSTYGAFETGERLAQQLWLDQAMQFYVFFPKSQDKIRAVRKNVYGNETVSVKTLLELLAEKDPTSFEKQLLRIRKDILSLSHKGEFIEAARVVRLAWSLVHSIVKEEKTRTAAQPQTAVLFAIACCSVANILCDLPYERKIIEFATEQWGGRISSALKMRLRYARFVNDLDRKRIHGLEASIGNSQMLRIVREARSTDLEKKNSLWDWIEYELEWNRLVSLTQPYGKKEAQYLEVIEHEYIKWEERWPEFGRTIRNARLRIGAVSKDPVEIIAAIQAIDHEPLRREDLISIMHSKVIALSRAKRLAEAKELGRIWMEKANEWGYYYQEERLFDRLEAIEEGQL